jgi:hypothetical protein
MIKLYKRIGGILHYHEAWEADGQIVEHWGCVGERGEQQLHRVQRGQSDEEAISAVLAGAQANGFEEYDEDKQVTVLVEYLIEGMGTSKDLEKRHKLEERMNETLGWTGLGSCDGGSIGSGTMEVCCFVVDEGVAKRVIADDLKGTPFGDYSRIFEE